MVQRLVLLPVTLVLLGLLMLAGLLLVVLGLVAHLTAVVLKSQPTGPRTGDN